jgi:hypothetical protein
VFNRSPYRDKKVVGVFAFFVRRFSTRWCGNIKQWKPSVAWVDPTTVELLKAKAMMKMRVFDHQMLGLQRQGRHHSIQCTGERLPSPNN